MNMLVLIFIFGLIAVAGLMLFVYQTFSRRQQKQRIQKLGAQQTNETRNIGDDFFAQVSTFVDPLSKLTIPNEEWERSHIHLKFLQAGWRGEDVPKLFFGIKTFLTFVLPILVFVNADPNQPKLNLLFFMLVTAMLGLYLPNILLNRAIKKRQMDLSNNFPDALDLLVITMEAGLSFDMALTRVAQEIDIKSKILSDELNILLLEMRSGFSRERALRNLTTRTGVEKIDALATLVIQSERFGTSIVDSLRIQSEQLRTTRMQVAQEQAAKIGVKLLFPLTLFILPPLFIILLGPSIKQLIDSFQQV